MVLPSKVPKSVLVAASPVRAEAYFINTLFTIVLAVVWTEKAILKTSLGEFVLGMFDILEATMN